MTDYECDKIAVPEGISPFYRNRKDKVSKDVVPPIDIDWLVDFLRSNYNFDKNIVSIEPGFNDRFIAVKVKNRLKSEMPKNYGGCPILVLEVLED